MEKIDLRKLSSLILFFSGAVLTFSGVVLYITPAGRITYWNDWILLGLSKTDYISLHTTISYLFLAFAIIHIIYNWGIIYSYLKNKKFKKLLVSTNAMLAIFITATFTFGTYLKVVPFQTIINVGEIFKSKWLGEYAEPPYGHAELSSIKVLAERTNLELTKVEFNLHSKGIKYSSLDESLLDIARKNYISPRELYSIMSKGLLPQNSNILPASGLGRLTLEEASKILNHDVAKKIKKLESMGYSATAEMTLKEISGQKNQTAHEIKELIETE
ncbi:MAG: DUF4405 domain-containing protein [Oligoflexia bacterium]|nr:DUF4405 domain-containing protein [Oligoflexia bacterium]